VSIIPEEERENSGRNGFSPLQSPSRLPVVGKLGGKRGTTSPFFSSCGERRLIPIVIEMEYMRNHLPLPLPLWERKGAGGKVRVPAVPLRDVLALKPLKTPNTLS
jgi:hypothetical protein